jgi:hypothetical protein
MEQGDAAKSTQLQIAQASLLPASLRRSKAQIQLTTDGLKMAFPCP